MTKYCVNCIHCKETMWCFHPIGGVDVVTGTIKPLFADWARRNGGRCGVEGKLFEPAKINIKPFWKFWK